MRFFPRGVGLLVLAYGLIASTAAMAQSRQSSSSGAAPTLIEQQRTGKGLFSQNCSLCHSPVKKNNKSTVEKGTSIGPLLDGIFSGPKPRPEAVVRTFIQRGVEGKMPAFQYGLEPKEIDAIIAYLKTL